MVITPYPAAPWHLNGTALLTFQLIDLAQAKAVIPADFQIISVFPGQTIGGLHFAIYSEGSTLTYSEMIVVTGLIKNNNQLGFWISHIYVDNPQSAAGGRNIWGLSKELAVFEWSKERVVVKQSDSLLCQLQYSQRGLPLFFMDRFKLSGNVFSILNHDILLFPTRATARPKWIKGTVSIPSHSPFAKFDIGKPWFTVQLPDLHFVANGPRVLGQLQNNLSSLAQQ